MVIPLGAIDDELKQVVRYPASVGAVRQGPGRRAQRSPSLETIVRPDASTKLLFYGWKNDN
jgi:hypothetical protein